MYAVILGTAIIIAIIVFVLRHRVFLYTHNMQLEQDKKVHETKVQIQSTNRLNSLLPEKN